MEDFEKRHAEARQNLEALATGEPSVESLEQDMLSMREEEIDAHRRVASAQQRVDDPRRGEQFSFQPAEVIFASRQPGAGRDCPRPGDDERGGSPGLWRQGLGLARLVCHPHLDRGKTHRRTILHGL